MAPPEFDAAEHLRQSQEAALRGSSIDGVTPRRSWALKVAVPAGPALATQTTAFVEQIGKPRITHVGGNMTRALAAEWGGYGITVNAIAPGYFPSKLTKYVLGAFEADLVARTPRGRLGGQNDLKGAALLLASDASAHITGQVLVMDGGASVI